MFTCVLPVAIQRGGYAVVAGNAETGIDRVQLVHRARGAGAVEDIAVNGVGARGVKLRQGVAGPGDAWGNGDISHPSGPILPV